MTDWYLSPKMFNKTDIQLNHPFQWYQNITGQWFETSDCKVSRRKSLHKCTSHLKFFFNTPDLVFEAF